MNPKPKIESVDVAAIERVINTVMTHSMHGDMIASHIEIMISEAVLKSRISDVLAQAAQGVKVMAIDAASRAVVDVLRSPEFCKTLAEGITQQAINREEEGA